MSLSQSLSTTRQVPYLRQEDNAIVFFPTSTMNIQFDFFIVYPLKKSCIFLSIDYVCSPDLTVIARALSVLVYN